MKLTWMYNTDYGELEARGQYRESRAMSIDHLIGNDYIHSYCNDEWARRHSMAIL